MAESPPLPKICVRAAPEECPQRQRGRPGPRPVPPASHRPHGQCQRIGDQALALQSDLSCEMAVGDQELDAIIRLLGAALDQFLAGS
jgi:hypothetical protein